MALALAMSTTLSEKNNPVIVPWPSAHRATGVRAGAAPGGRGLSGSRGSTSTERLMTAWLFMIGSCSWKTAGVPVDVLVGVLTDVVMWRNVMAVLS
jgi:hypothetical protein